MIYFLLLRYKLVTIVGKLALNIGDITRIIYWRLLPYPIISLSLDYLDKAERITGSKRIISNVISDVGAFYTLLLFYLTYSAVCGCKCPDTNSNTDPIWFITIPLFVESISLWSEVDWLSPLLRICNLLSVQTIIGSTHNKPVVLNKDLIDSK
jgi:hypothetical protein